MPASKKGAAACEIFTLEKVVYVGLISYSLYLWHWGVLSISRWTIGIHWWSVPIQVGLMLLMAMGSYCYIETPVRKGSFHWNKQIIILTGTGASIFTAFLVATGSRYIKDSLYLGQSPEDLRRGEVGGMRIYCQYWRGMKIFDPGNDITKCSYGPNLGKYNTNTIYCVGDSHAGDLGGLIAKLQGTTEAKHLILATGGVPFPPLPLGLYPQNERHLTQKDIKMQQQISSKILQLSERGDLIVVASGYRLLSSANPVNRRKILSALRSSIDELSKELLKRKVNLVLMAPRPYFAVPKEYEKNPINFTTSNCAFSPGLRRNCVLLANREHLRSSLRQIDEILLDLSKAYPNVFIYDQFDALCPEGYENCSTLINDKMAFYDHHHLNNFGSALLYPSFRKFLDDKKLLR